MREGPLDSFEGPRTLRYFSILLLFTVLLFVLGVVLSTFYGFDLLKNITQYFVENPVVLLELAGILSLGALGIIAWGFASQHLD